MPRYVRFTFLVNPDERRTLDTLASRLQRSRSDTVRFLIRSASTGTVELPTVPSQQVVKAPSHARA